MAEQTHVIKRVEKVRGRDLQGKVHVLDKTQPQQLVLFQTFLPEDDSDEKFSNTIEFYDAIPKYFSNPRLMDSMRKDGIYLPRLERDFQHRGETYKVTIRPARLTGRDGMDKEYYPGPREELVEEALRKLACDRLNGVYLDDQAGVQFTIYELHKELQARGHDFARMSLVESLRICNESHIRVTKDHGELVLGSAIFPVLLLARKKEWIQNPKDTRCYVQFHPLITQCISHLTYRQFDYAVYMSYTYRLSRWLHKRLAHMYTQAGMLHPYTIRLSTILRDSGTLECAQNYNNARSVERALDELERRQIILAVTKETLRGPRNRLLDIKAISQKESPYSGCWCWVDQNVVLGQCRMALQSFFNCLHRHFPERNALLVDFVAEFDDRRQPLPGHPLGPLHHGLCIDQLRPIPLQLQDTPAPLDGMIFAVVRRIIQELNWLVNVVGELHHAMQKLRTPATALRAIIHFDVQQTRGGLLVFIQGIPLGCERIHDEVTRFVGAAKGNRQLGALLIDNPTRDILLLAPPIMITGLVVAPGETAARILTDMHCRFTIDAQAFDAA